MKACPHCGCTTLWRLTAVYVSVNGPLTRTSNEMGFYDEERPIRCWRCDVRSADSELIEVEKPDPERGGLVFGNRGGP